MRYILLLFVALLASSMLWCCTPSPKQDTLAQAEAAADAGNHAKALALCDEFMETADNGDPVSAVSAARASVLYIRLADEMPNDDGEAVGQAIRAYNLAMKLHADSAQHYYSSVSGDNIRHVKMLINVVRGLEMPDSAIVVEEEFIEHF